MSRTRYAWAASGCCGCGPRLEWAGGTSAGGLVQPTCMHVRQTGAMVWGNHTAPRNHGVVWWAGRSDAVTVPLPGQKN